MTVSHHPRLMDHCHRHSHLSGSLTTQSDRGAHTVDTMSDSAYSVPIHEEPAVAPAFGTGGLSDARGWLEWVPELVLGLDLADVGPPPPAGGWCVSSGSPEPLAPVRAGRLDGVQRGAFRSSAAPSLPEEPTAAARHVARPRHVLVLRAGYLPELDEELHEGHE